MATVKIGKVRVSLTDIARRGLPLAYERARQEQHDDEERARDLGRRMAEREGRLRGAPNAVRCPICGRPRTAHDPACCARRP